MPSMFLPKTRSEWGNQPLGASIVGACSTLGRTTFVLADVLEAWLYIARTCEKTQIGLRQQAINLGKDRFPIIPINIRAPFGD